MSANCSELQPGAITFGRSGGPLRVIQCRPNFVTVQRPDGETIDVKPSAILRWENCEKPSPESEVKISSEPSESVIEALEPLLDNGFASDDTLKNIVRISSEPSESIVRKHEYRPNIVRKESLTPKGFQPLSDGSDGSDDIFEPLSAQRYFENFAISPPPHPYPIGCIVHKRHRDGWMGIVFEHIGSSSVDVLWWLEKYPSRIDASDLRLADKSVAESSVKAFAALGVNPGLEKIIERN